MNSETAQSLPSRPEDRARRLALMLLLFLFLAAAAFQNYRKSAKDLRIPQALENAQLARNIVQGNGFHTGVIRPVGLTVNANLTRQVGSEVRSAHPDMMNPPLFPLFTALLFALGGVSDRTAIFASALSILLASWMAYLLARRLFGGRIALWCLTVFWVLPGTAGLFFSGVSTPWAAFLTTALFYSLAGLNFRTDAAEEAQSALPGRRAFGIGVLFGLCYLSQYNLLYLFLPVAVYLYLSQRPRASRPLALFVTGFLAVSALWMARNLSVAHNPFFSLDQYSRMAATPDYPQETVFRQWEKVGQPLVYSLTHPRQALKRLVVNASDMHRAWPAVTGLYLMPLFLLSLLISFRQPIQDRFKYLVAACLASVAVGVAFVRSDQSFFYALAPAMMILGLALLLRLIDTLKLAPPYKTAVAVLIFAWMFVPTAATLALALPPEKGRSAAYYSELKEKSVHVVIANNPWQAAWLADRVAIWLPARPADFIKQYRTVEGVLLTNTRDYDDIDTRAWRTALDLVINVSLNSIKNEGKPEIPKAVKEFIPFEDAHVKVLTDGKQIKGIPYVLWTRPQKAASRNTDRPRKGG